MRSRNVLLIFDKEIMYKPIIYRLARDFDVIFNVLEAKILPKLEGRLILELQFENQPSFKLGKDLRFQHVEYHVKVPREAVDNRLVHNLFIEDEEHVSGSHAVTPCASVNSIPPSATSRSPRTMATPSAPCSIA